MRNYYANKAYESVTSELKSQLIYFQWLKTNA